MKMKVFGNIIRTVCGAKNWFGGGVAKALAAAAALAFAGAALAGTYNDGTYTWTYRDLPSGGVELFKASLTPAIAPKPTGELAIPSHINGKPVTSIGSYAFYQCSDLEKVTIPDTVASIGWGAFMNCSGLQEVVVPDSVVSVDGKAFASCVALSMASLPSRFVDVVGKDSNVFEDCNKSILDVMYLEKVGGIVWHFQVDGGAAKLFNGTRPVIPATTAGHIDIPSRLGGYQVRSIGVAAFMNCSGLTSVRMPKFVESIEMAAFAECSALKSVMLILPYYLTSIGNSAFAQCTALRHMSIPSGVTLGTGTFAGCAALTTVHVYKDETATVKTQLETSGLDTSGLTFVEDFAVRHTETVNGIEWHFLTNGEESEIENRVDSAIPSDTAGDITVPATLGGCPVTRIGEAAFRGCASLTGVTLPASVTSIGDQAFENCSSLKMVVPETVTSLGDAFNGCDAMADEDGFVIVRGVLHHYAGSEKDVEVPDGVKRIGENAFSHCDSLKYVTLPATVSVIGRGAFYSCDALADAIMRGVTSIDSQAFAYCKSLGDVTFPSSVKSIGYSAFMECTSLTEVSIPKSVAYIDKYAFYSAPLDTVYVAPGDQARVEKLLIDSSFDTSGITSWYDTGMETSFTVDFDANDGSVAETTRNVASGAAVGALPTPTRTGWAFRGWYTEAWEGEGVRITPATIVTDDMTCYAQWMPEGAEMWVDEDGVEWVYRIADGKAEIYNDEDKPAIPYMTRGYVTVPATLGGYPVTRIGESAFASCHYLTSVAIPDTVTSIGNEAFLECDGMADASGFVIVRGVLYYYNGSATSLTIPADVTEISGSAFADCDKLTRVTIPDAVTAIGDWAFWGCKGMADENGFVIVRDVLHYYAGAAAEVTVPNTVVRIGNSAFIYKTSLTSVTIPPSVESIGRNAFDGDTSLKTVHVVKGDKGRVRQMIEDSGYDTTGLDFVEDMGGWTKETVDGIVWIFWVDKDGKAEVGSSGKNPAIPRDTAGAIVVPSELGGYPVTRIGDYAFYRCIKLTDVTIPSGVTSIGDSAFNRCTTLANVSIPPSVTDIGHQAFRRCRGLADENGFVIVSNVLYFYAGSAAEVTIPDDVTAIDSGAFSDNSDMESVMVPSGVTEIGSNAFNGCIALASATIPASVTKIGAYAFEGTALETVYVEKGDTARVSGLIADSEYDVSNVKFIEPVEVFSVTFNANGGTCAETSRDVEDGTAVGELPTPTRAGFTFGGWFTEKDAGSQIDASTTVTADVTFFAHWVSPQTWVTTRSDAIAEALRTGKKIFLLCGRDTCYNTMTTKKVSCEDPLVKDELAAKCVLWYSNCDTQEDENWDYLPWGSFTLPVVCIIDPKDPDHYLKRTTGGDHGGPLSAADVLAFIADVPYPAGANPAASGSGFTPSGGAGYVFLSPGDITAPYSAAKTLHGAIYNGSDVVGVVELKLGRINARKGTSRVSGAVTLLDGKRYTIKGVQALVGTAAPLTVTLEVKKVGTMTVTIGGDLFAGSLGGWHVQTANVGGNWNSAPTVSVDASDLSMIPGTVLDALLPNAEKGVSSGTRWTFAKATSVKWAKPKAGETPVVLDAASGKGLLVDTTKDRTNLSGMKLTYTAKKGTFKGSFKVYALEGSGASTKLKKYNLKVGGVVVNGVGYGEATCKRPAITWSLKVR